MGCSVVMIKPQPHTLGLFHALEKVSMAPVGALHLLRVKGDPNTPVEALVQGYPPASRWAHFRAKIPREVTRKAV